jgi:hypothetical protein
MSSTAFYAWDEGSEQLQEDTIREEQQVRKKGLTMIFTINKMGVTFCI